MTEPPCTVNAQMNGEHYVEPPNRANVVGTDKSGDSAQKLPRQSPKNAEVSAATTETSTAAPSTGPPPPTSVGANVVGTETSGYSTQKLSGQSPKITEVAAATTETSIAAPSAGPLLRHQ